MIHLITFEGCDGSGKTTQVKLMENYFTSNGRTCLLTREPGGSTLGNTFRQLLKDSPEEGIGEQAELFLYLADRAQHVREVIQPAIDTGKLILCDRFTDSTLAYQGYGRGGDLIMLRHMNELASGGIKPDLTLLLDGPVEFFISRMEMRSKMQGSRGVRDRFDSEGSQFHERVRNGFLELAKTEPERFVIINADLPVAEVHESIKKIILARLG